jgi:hypothetical protein
MEIVNFFEKLAGRWFSQRTTHALSSQQSKAGKSDLEVSFLAPDADEVEQLWRSHKLFQTSDQNSVTPLCGLSIHQSSTVEGDSQPHIFTTLLVPLAPDLQEDKAFFGKLLRSGMADSSTYILEEEVLTIVTDSPEARSEERLWFVNDNVRMRTNTTELTSGPNSGLRIASFCSEIRLGAKPPTAT